MFKKQFNNCKSKGFTLIELIVVIAIVGILATFIVTNVASNLKRARDAERTNSLKQIQTALELYYQDNGEYPDTGWVNSKDQEGVHWIPGLDEKYIKEMPVDPKNSGCTSQNTSPKIAGCYALGYYSWTTFCDLTGQGYILATRLEATDTTEFSRKNIINPTTGALCQKTCSVDENGQAVSPYNVTTWAECPVKGLYVLVNP